MWYTSPPALSDGSCWSRVICVGCVGILAEPVRCGTMLSFDISLGSIHSLGRLLFAIVSVDCFILFN